MFKYFWRLKIFLSLFSQEYNGLANPVFIQKEAKVPSFEEI